LEVPESKWFVMNAQQRRKYLSKVHSTEVVDATSHDCLQPRDLAVSSSAPEECNVPKQAPFNLSVLSVDLERAAQHVNIPFKCLEGLWDKAIKLINSNNSIVSAPGHDPEARMVLSYSGKVSHLVTPKKGGDFSCDSSCPSWKAMGICSHSVAVAEINKKMPQFLSVRKRKRSVNVTNLLTTNMPKGRGRKGGAAPRSRKPPLSVSGRIEMSIPSTSTSVITPSTVNSEQVPNAREEADLTTSFVAQQPTPVHYGNVQSCALPVCSSLQPFHQGVMQHMPHSQQSSPLTPFSLCFITGTLQPALDVTRST
jgi:hypothetical protein